MMDNNEIFLNLKGFENNIKRSWKDLQIDSDFCDVTLVADNNQISAHKIIISSCSPVLGNILKSNPHPHPLIYLRQVKYKDLKNLVTFMYQGEVSVPEEDLHVFLGVAKDLEVRGLSDKNRTLSDFSQKEDFQNDMQNSIVPMKKETRVDSVENANKSKNEFDQIFEDSIDILDILSTKEYQSNDQKEDYLESNLKFVSSDTKRKEFKCEKCVKHFKFKSKLKMHVQAVHEENRYSCEKCSYEGRDKSYLKKHTKFRHDGVSYPCKQCNYTAANQFSLKSHVESVHEGKYYHCNQCTYKASQKGNLKIHEDIMHKETSLSCKKCGNISKTKHNLKMHIDLFHSGA